MNLRLLQRVSFVLAVVGLFLIYFFSPTQQHTKKTVAEIQKDCSGQVSVEGRIGRISYSSNGNLIAELYQNRSKIMVFLRDDVFREGDNLSIFGKANRFSNQCWIFPERVEPR